MTATETLGKGARVCARWGAVATAVLALIPASAGAQEVEESRVAASNGDGMDTHLFRPAVDSKGFFSVNGSDVLGDGDVSFGMVMDYGGGILRTNQERDPGVDPEVEPGRGVDALVQHSFQGTFQFNYGIAHVVIVGVTVPILLMAADEAFQLGPNGGLYDTDKLDVQTFGGAALHGKWRLTRVDDGFGVALIGQVGFSNESAARGLGAEPGVWYWPRLVTELRAGRTKWLKLGADVGYRGHTGKNPRFDQDALGRDQLAEGPLEYGNLGTFGAGLSLRALESLDLVVETYGTYLLADAAADQRFSQEVVGGLKLFVERNSYLMLGGGSRHGATSKGFQAADLRMLLGFVFEPSIGDRDGDGYKDDVDGCPDEAEDFDEFRDADGCPDPDNDNDGILDEDDACRNVPEDRDGDQDDDGCPEGSDGDRDGDGILDSRDRCPDVPEDRDGFEDKDGCPEPDNDRDGILDKDDDCPDDPEDKDGFEDKDGCPDPDNDQDGLPDSRDKCPNEPETFNGLDDEDGCPDKGKVVIEGSDIVILEKVQFATGSAEILRASDPILDAVAAALKGHPEFLLLEVAGHADERGNDATNLRLTRERAAAVMDALVARGVERARLVSQGYGEYCPIDPGRGEKAWEKNRRVEFKIIKTEDGSTGAERGCEEARRKGVHPPRID
ncbi:MAG: OmpA family protein [Polyangiaceae bacterium]|nr:OmpA family protein [Polyangiaceae bacterium]